VKDHPPNLVENVYLLKSAAECLGVAGVPVIIKEVEVVTATWRQTSKEAGRRPAEITRMTSVFEHHDLKQALPRDADFHP
jgi:serine/threonine-protein kinase HipA